MKSKLIVLFLLFSLSISAYSQIENEIKSYVDSTELIVNNGRKLLVDQIKKENYQKVKEIYTYLNDATETRTTKAFYFVEHIYINTILQDWDSFLRYAANYNSLKSQTISQSNSYIFTELHNFSKEHVQEYQENIEFSKLSSDEKLVVELLLELIKNDKPSDRYSMLLKAYQNSTSNKYEHFVQDFLPNKPIKASFSYSFGSGILLPTQKLKSGFSTTPLAAMDMDFNIGKVYTSLYFQGAGFAFNNQVSTQLNYSLITFHKGDKISYFEGGLKLGYLVHRGERLNIAPYTIIAGATLESNIYEEESNYDEFTVLNSFCYGAGFKTELKLKEFVMNNYYGYEEQSFVSLKLDCSYKQFAKFNMSSYKGALPSINLSLVWGFGSF